MDALRKPRHSVGMAKGWMAWLGACCVYWSNVGNANALTFRVDSALDQLDSAVGDGLCRTVAGTCTLRAAIQEANVQPGHDTIRLGAGTFELSRSVVGYDDAPIEPGALSVDPDSLPVQNDIASGDLDVLDDLDLKGAGPELTQIKAAGDWRLFECWPRNLLHAGDAAFRLRLSNVTLSDGVGSYGGAVRSLCHLEAYRVRVTANVARLRGGGLAIDWSPGSEKPTLSLIHARIEDNRGRDGGGVWVAGSWSWPALIRDAEFAGNLADISAGGLLSDASSVVLDSYFQRNSAGWYAGGALTTGSSWVGYSTFEDNEALTYHGGGLFVSGSDPSILVNSTFVNNFAPDGAAVSTNATLSINNVTIADHPIFAPVLAFGLGSSVELSNGALQGNHRCASTVSSGGYNFYDYACGTPASTDVEGPVNISTMLTTSTTRAPTLALLASSPAINGANPAEPGSVPGSCERDDQRHLPRPMAGRCDAGAWESQTRCALLGGPDTDGDGLLDACDADDDDDTCLDAYDQHPTEANPVTGMLRDFCGEDREATAFEGVDSDGDGLTNCEDPDDDDDGSPDDEDGCLDGEIGCISFYLGDCFEQFWPLACAGTGCYEFNLRLALIRNPREHLILERFAISNGQFFAAPRTGDTAARSIAALVKLAEQGETQLEIWTAASKGEQSELWSVVGEIEFKALKVGRTDLGNSIWIAPTFANGQLHLDVASTWRNGALPGALPDVDADAYPDAFDNCVWLPNPGQKDNDRNGIGDECRAPKKQVCSKFQNPAQCALMGVK